MTSPDTADAVTLFCGAQVSPDTADVYGFQMRRYADWLQVQYYGKIVKANTTHAGRLAKLLDHSTLSTTEIYLDGDRGRLEQAVIGDPLNGL